MALHRNEFRAPWGRLLTGTSIGIVALFAAIIVAGLVLWFPAAPWWTFPLVTLTTIAVLVGALPFVVRGYAVSSQGILIRRLWWNTVLPRSAIRSAEFAPNAMSRSLRACGNGGAFSITGWYWNKRLGFYKAYVTDLNRTVVVRMSHRTAVLSPDDPQAFVAAVNEIAGL